MQANNQPLVPIVNVPPTAKKYDYLITGEELLLSPVKQLPCLWEPYFIQQGLIALTGGSDVGKSSFLRQFAISVVLKESSFLGSPLNVRHGRALYLATEDSKMAAQVALHRSIDGTNVQPNQLKGLCYLINPANPIQAVEEQLKVSNTDVVIIDSFADVFKGNLNDNTAVRSFLNSFQRLSEKYDTLIIFLHHVCKRLENSSPNKNNVIGSQGFEAKMRLVMELRKPDSSNRRDLYFVKGNNLPESVKTQGLQLNFDNKQQFQITGNSFVTNANARTFSKEEKDQIMEVAFQFKLQGMSFDKIRMELSKLDFAKVPSKGILIQWFSKSNLDEIAGQSVE